MSRTVRRRSLAPPPQQSARARCRLPIAGTAHNPFGDRNKRFLVPSGCEDDGHQTPPGKSLAQKRFRAGSQTSPATDGRAVSLDVLSICHSLHVRLVESSPVKIQIQPNRQKSWSSRYVSTPKESAAYEPRMAGAVVASSFAISFPAALFRAAAAFAAAERAPRPESRLNCRIL